MGKADETYKLQEALTRLGFDPGPLDGVPGAQTKAALIAFQKGASLVPDGVPGKITMKALAAALAKETVAKVDAPPKLGDVKVQLADLKKGTLPFYEKAYSMLEFDQGYEGQVAACAKRILAGKARYEGVAKPFGAPWVMVGLIHNLEASCAWNAVLHNGQRIVGTNRKTTIVPKGKGPFKTWEEAALDALKGMGFANIKTWSLGFMLQWIEKFNGWGYVTGAGRNETSPYVWAMSNINSGRGKYLSDGKYSPSADANTQCGAATALKWLERNGHVDLTSIRPLA